MTPKGLLVSLYPSPDDSVPRGINRLNEEDYNPLRKERKGCEKNKKGVDLFGYEDDLMEFSKAMPPDESDRRGRRDGHDPERR